MRRQTGYVALLRGINVGGRNKVPMAILRDILEASGHTGVATFLQSGNGIFTSERRDEAALMAELEAAIEVRLGLPIRIVVRSHAELADVVAANPLPEAAAEPARFTVSFLSEAPDRERLAAFDRSAFPSEEVRFVAREAYIWYRAGIGNSKLTNSVLERRLGVTATARNWNTVIRLVELTENLAEA